MPLIRNSVWAELDRAAGWTAFDDLIDSPVNLSQARRAVELQLTLATGDGAAAGIGSGQGGELQCSRRVAMA
ncbi:MAG: hypothetical protein KGJ60_11190 [Verrucomicrobiota bacterium]|nr:hypothetical protein [Verrucomicrobiota bacterium]